jgi:dihydrofolate reductase
MIFAAEGIMRRLIVFNNISLDGYFVDANGSMAWARSTTPDADWDAFMVSNSTSPAGLVFGRITYDLMVSFWPTPMAAKDFPVAAAGMNSAQKIVFSRTMDKASWNNTRLVKTDPVAEMRRLKSEPGPDLCILGSGNIVAQLAPEGLIDEYLIAVIPVVLGKGRTMFEGVTKTLSFTRTKTKPFANGHVLLCYEPIR